MSPTPHDLLRDRLPAELLSHTREGVLLVSPSTTGQVAEIMTLAHEAGWRVAVRGAGTWTPGDAPCDLVVSTTGLTAIPRVSPADLTATVETGVPLDALQQRLAAGGAWLPLDPPGHPGRTLGSVLATATAGALQHSRGTPRELTLGCTVVTGDGRVVTAGGAVVKNVAGYDLTRLQIGAFGALGILTEVHLRLRALPEADRTLLLTGPRDQLTRCARHLTEIHLEAAAIELASPRATATGDWVLLIRLLGSAAGTAAEAARITEAVETPVTVLTPEEAHQLRQTISLSFLGIPCAIRLGVLPDGIDDTLDMLINHLGEGPLTAEPASGGIRIGADPDAEMIHLLRRTLAEREIPLTVERAPWALRSRTGHFGAYREGVGALVTGLQATFDPAATLVVPRVSLD